jgi:hypothetical protein
METQVAEIPDELAVLSGDWEYQGVNIFAPEDIRKSRWLSVGLPMAEDEEVWVLDSRVDYDENDLTVFVFRRRRAGSAGSFS